MQPTACHPSVPSGETHSQQPFPGSQHWPLQYRCSDIAYCRSTAKGSCALQNVTTWHGMAWQSRAGQGRSVTHSQQSWSGAQHLPVARM
jgi:hypothetical protein